MARAKVTYNLPGINKVMRSDGVARVVRAKAREMAAAAGEGFEAVERPQPHPWTARAYVQVADEVGARREADEKVLNRVLGEAQL